MHLLALGMALLSTCDQPASSPVRSDERVVLFPALGSPVEGGWSVHARGWIFEPELDSDWRQNFIEILGSAAPCGPQADASIFNERARAFVVDNERGKSDLDDTVRISHVGDPAALLRSTFCEPFRGIAEVRDVLKALRERGAAFHYVSASPWQFYEPLRAFMDAEGFPAGSFHLKTVRLRDETFLDLFKDAAAWKKPVIEGLMDRWPGRRFILIGDCGESDPEIYAGLARSRPEQVEHVYIRDAKKAGRGDARFARAFEGVAADRWALLSPEQK